MGNALSDALDAKNQSFAVTVAKAIFLNELYIAIGGSGLRFAARDAVSELLGTQVQRPLEMDIDLPKNVSREEVDISLEALAASFPNSPTNDIRQEIDMRYPVSAFGDKLPYGTVFEYVYNRMVGQPLRGNLPSNQQ